MLPEFCCLRVHTLLIIYDNLYQHNINKINGCNIFENSILFSIINQINVTLSLVHTFDTKCNLTY